MAVIDIINIAKISEYLATIDIEKSGVYAGGIDHLLPQKLYNIRKSIEWLYDLNSSDISLIPTSNYLYSLCAPYSLEAANILAAGSGGSVSPITPSGGGSGSALLRLVITNSNLSGNDYNDPRIVGKNIQIFISAYNEEWLYAPANFTQTATGISITAPGFDPSTYSYQIIIQEYTPVSGVITQLATPTNIVNTFIGSIIKYDWDDVTNATAYIWQLASDFSFTNILASGTVTISEVMITGLTPAPPLYFRVYATATGYAQSANGTRFFTPAALATPILSFSNITTTGFKTSWTQDANSNVVDIDIATDSSFATIVLSIQGTNIGEYTFGLGTTGTTYYVRVKQSRNPAWYNPSSFGTGSTTTS